MLSMYSHEKKGDLHILIWKDIQDRLGKWKMQVSEKYTKYNQTCENKNN